MSLRRSGASAALVAASLIPGTVTAAAKQTLDDGWPAQWNRIGVVETAGIAAMGLGAALLEVAAKPAFTPRWDSPILFDADARSTLRAGSAGGRSRAATASDVAYIGLPVYAIGVEAGLLTWVGKDKADAAVQLALINFEALGVNALLSRVTQKAVARARPDNDPTKPDNTAFFSGHTSTAFTIASGLCVQHARLQIYGGIADQVVCPASLAVAATTGLLRIVADRHWASDVIGGAIFGSAVGASVSWLHLRGESAPSATLSLGAGGRSLIYVGRF